jgi:hypothetical protein
MLLINVPNTVGGNYLVALNPHLARHFTKFTGWVPVAVFQAHRFILALVRRALSAPWTVEYRQRKHQFTAKAFTVFQISERKASIKLNLVIPILTSARCRNSLIGIITIMTPLRFPTGLLTQATRLSANLWSRVQ